MIKILDPSNPLDPFPDVNKALDEPNGLLAIGGCLSWQRLHAAYTHGIFPWFGPGEPILWWSPQPRLVLKPEKLKISRSLAKNIRNSGWRVTWDTAFLEVLRGCAEPRGDTPGTWLTTEMIAAYCDLHHRGLAHCFETWHEDRLIGGLYGVTIGRVFFGESMFYRAANASKVAFASGIQALQSWDYQLIDCQVHTSHLASLGAENVPRSIFVEALRELTRQSPSPRSWKTVPED